MNDANVEVLTIDEEGPHHVGDGVLIHPHFVLVLPPLSEALTRSPASIANLEVRFVDGAESTSRSVESVHISRHTEPLVGLDFREPAPIAPAPIGPDGPLASFLSGNASLVPRVPGTSGGDQNLSVCDIWSNAWFCIGPEPYDPGPLLD